ncbi:MAG: type IV pilus secretin PilQ [Vicinamibacterales bacterium]
MESHDRHPSAARRGTRARVAIAAALAGALAAAGAAGGASARAASGTELPTLRAISSRLDGRLSTIRIEATEPVAYVTSQPNALTVLVDLRNVRADAVAASSLIDPLAPVRAVRVEGTTSADGVPVARIRVDLERPAPHRVRSTRNLIVVEVDRASAQGAPSAAASPARPATRVREEAPVVLNTDLAPVGPATPLSAAAQPAAFLSQEPAAPPPPQPPTGGVTLSPQTTTTPRFTGHPITLDFQGADLRAVLRTFSEISGLNVVIDPSITGTVDVSLRDVPWDQALDIILKANKLGYAVDGTIVRIAPITVLADEEAERRKLTDAQALAGELRVLTRPLSYARAQDLVPIVTRSALSTRGEVQVDARTNTLIIRDLADRLQGAADILAALDRPQPQVEIEARIIQTTRDFARELGVQWGLTARADAALGNTTGLAFPNSGSLTGRIGEPQGPGGADGAVSLGAPNASSALGLALGSITGAFNLDVALSALERNGKGRLLSTPRVSTQNNVEAEITQGVQIPIQTVANNTVTVQFKDAALTLRVTPQITASNTVIMRISLENATADFSRAVNGIPPINTQRALTSVLVGDGETTVIGGIYLSNEQTNESGVPGLRRLPLLGWLFKRNIVGDESRELLIFITPRITRS